MIFGKQRMRLLILLLFVIVLTKINPCIGKSIDLTINVFLDLFGAA